MKKLIPNVELHYELPQWIISSEIAAYAPSTNTIYMSMKYNRPFGVFLKNFGHECIHHLIQLISGEHRYQILFDEVAAILEGVDLPEEGVTDW